MKTPRRSRAPRQSEAARFQRRYEGPEVLGALLAQAQSPYTVPQVVEMMKQAQASSRDAAQLFPSLFSGEPRFSDVSAAKRTFENLFGLWDSLSRSAPPPAAAPSNAPGAFGAEGPSPEFISAALRHMDGWSERERTRHLHSFENRQDGLLTWLDGTGLSDEGYAVARHLLFEFHAMLELGWRPGVQSVASKELQGHPAQDVIPPSLLSYLDGVLFESEQEEEAPLSGEEVARVRREVVRGLGALWKARRPRKEDGDGQPKG